MVGTERSKIRRHRYYSGRQRRRSRCLASRPLTKRSLLPNSTHCLCLQLSHRTYFQLFRQNYGTYRQNFIKDSQHALEIFHDLNFLGRNKLISLWELHLSILSLLMTKVSGPSNIFSIDALLRNLALKWLLRPAELVLTLNCFSFGGNYFKQTNGVAMGAKVGPTFANINRFYLTPNFLSISQPQTWSPGS